MARATRKEKPASRKVDTQDPFQNLALAKLDGDTEIDAVTARIRNFIQGDKEKISAGNSGGRVCSVTESQFGILVPDNMVKSAAAPLANAIKACFAARGMQIRYVGLTQPRGDDKELAFAFTSTPASNDAARTEALKALDIVLEICDAAETLHAERGAKRSA